MSWDTLHTDSRIELDGRPAADLVGISGYAIVATTLLAIGGFPSAIRVPIALPLLLFVPGYAVVTALLPRSRTVASDENGRGARDTGAASAGLAPLERATLATVASVAVVPMVALLVDAVVALTLVPVLVGIVVVTLGASAVGLYRRPTRPPADPFTTGFSQTDDAALRDRLAAAIPRDRVTLAAIVVAALLVTTSAAIALSGGSSDGGATTEFYLVNDTDDGRFPGDDAYPGTLRAGNSHPFALGIDHEAGGPRDYTVVTVLEWVDHSGNGTRVVSFEELARETTTVPAGDPQVRNYSVVPETVGPDLRVAFLLYRGDAPAVPSRESAHRVLRFPVTVTPNAD